MNSVGSSPTSFALKSAKFAVLSTPLSLLLLFFVSVVPRYVLISKVIKLRNELFHFHLTMKMCTL